jgi:hypothetical protein
MSGEPKRMSREPDHWGQFDQGRIFPPGTTLELRAYRAPRPEWDHDHCIFCWAKLMDPSLSDASRRMIEKDPEILTAGYTGEANGAEWVCPSCFEEFSARFEWRAKAE